MLLQYGVAYTHCRLVFHKNGRQVTNHRRAIYVATSCRLVFVVLRRIISPMRRFCIAGRIHVYSTILSCSLILYWLESASFILMAFIRGITGIM
jgi:uncharacterized membrane protein YozB (DUF420 family)